MTGVGRHVTDLIKGMTARGHEVHLLHSSRRCDETLLGELDQSPRFYHRAYAMRRQPHWSDVLVLMELISYLRKFGPFDVIHGHSSKGGAYARLLGLCLPGSCLYTPHALVTMSPHLTPGKRALYGAVERYLGRITDTVICCSYDEAEHAAGLGIPEERMALIANGVAPFEVTSGVALRERLGLLASTVVIGFVGRLDEQKAPRRLIEAAVDVCRRGHDVHVVMLGAGPLRAELEALTQQVGIPQRFHWLGETPARTWIGGFDILALPSLYEGFPYVLLEALHAGVPIVCTPVGGVRDVGFVDGEHGFVVPRNDARALADRLCRLVTEPDLRRAMGRNARSRSEAFSLDKMLDRVEATYRQASGTGALRSAAPTGL